MRLEVGGNGLVASMNAVLLAAVGSGDGEWIDFHPLNSTSFKLLGLMTVCWYRRTRWGLRAEAGSWYIGQIFPLQFHQRILLYGRVAREATCRSALKWEDLR